MIKLSIQETKENKKNRLLDTGFKLFTEKGIQNTSIQDIVDNANVAKGTFYLYFKDKYELRDILVAKKSHKLLSLSEFSSYKRTERQKSPKVSRQIIINQQEEITMENNNINIKELLEKLQSAKSAEELIEMAKAEGVEIPADKVEELSDEDVENIAGGFSINTSTIRHNVVGHRKTFN